MKRVGVYVFTDMVKSRNTKRREGYFDGQNYIGLRYILTEIDRSQYEICYVSKDTVNSVDFVLVSLSSYYDVQNLINELLGRTITATVIVGGAGCNNVGLLRAVADYVIVGRGEGIIPRLLNGECVPGVYSKRDDPDISRPIKIFPLSKYIEIADDFLGQYCERSIGCPRKCYFCEYSWKHKWQARDDGYASGLLNRETLLQDVDWAQYKNKDFVTAIDGATERTRKVINKPITNRMITEKMLEIYDAPRDYVSLKLYCLLGYPFETKFEPEEAIEAIISARREGNPHRCNVLMVSPHFIPMPFTPMECESINWHNFREDIRGYDWEKFGRGNVNVYWNWSLASAPVGAAEATILNRADEKHAGAIKSILCSSKYKNLSALAKRMVCEKYFGDLLGRVASVLPYIERNNATEAAKALYEKRKEAACHGDG